MYVNANMPASMQPVPKKDNNLATAALVTGILSIITAFLCTVYLPLIFSAVSITLALLSKGSERKMQGTALAGFITSISALVLDVVIVIVSFYLVFSVPEYKQQFDDLCRQMYGETFEEMIDGNSIDRYE